MAKLIIAINLTFKEEGLWSDGKGKNANDSGGRTYKGIAENANKDWGGWIIINKHLKDKNFPQCLEDIPELQILTETRYRVKYWNPFWGDKILNQNTANNLFDTSVNFGASVAIKMMQQAVKLKSTGIMDEITLTKLNDIV